MGGRAARLSSRIPAVAGAMKEAKRRANAKSPVLLYATRGFRYSGSPTWTRTRDLRINSPSLYRLSYQGIVAVLLKGCAVGDHHAPSETWLPDLDSNQGPAD